MKIHQQIEASRTANGMLAISCCLPGSDFGCERNIGTQKENRLENRTLPRTPMFEIKVNLSLNYLFKGGAY